MDNYIEEWENESGNVSPELPVVECKVQQFLDDPITREAGVGGEMMHLIKCDCPDCQYHPTFQGLRDQESEEPHGSFPFLEDY